MLGTRRLRLAKQKRYLISEGRKILAQLSQQGSPSQINKENVNVWFAAVEDFLRLTLSKGSVLFDQCRGIRKSVTATNNSVPVSTSSQGLTSSPGKLSEEPKKEEILDNPPSPQLGEHTTPPRMEANGSESAVSGTDSDKASAALNVERSSATLAILEHVELTTIPIQSNLEADKEDD